MQVFTDDIHLYKNHFVYQKRHLRELLQERIAIVEGYLEIAAASTTEYELWREKHVKQVGSV